MEGHVIWHTTQGKLCNICPERHVVTIHKQPFQKEIYNAGSAFKRARHLQEQGRIKDNIYCSWHTSKRNNINSDSFYPCCFEEWRALRLHTNQETLYVTISSEFGRNFVNWGRGLLNPMVHLIHIIFHHRHQFLLLFVSRWWYSASEKKTYF